MSHKFNYIWRLADGFPAKGIEPNNRKVFGTFVCGGGSAMGYKLAGYDYLGGVEIDPKVAEIYKRNLNPKYLFVNDIRDFNKMDLPDELYNLDILDGSPPCTSFSMNGVREKHWGKLKHFDEGSALQTLNDLVFVYCDTIEKLKPKVCLLENVEGLIKGNAKVYAKEISRRMTKAGYDVQVFLLNAKYMGVPQDRRRVFFIGRRKELGLPNLKLEFNEKPICFGEFADYKGRPVTGEQQLLLWNNRRIGDRTLADPYKRLFGKGNRYSVSFIYGDRVRPTTTTTTEEIHFDKPLHLSYGEMVKSATFPIDYDAPEKKITHLVGMCVPPVMTAQIAHQINEQWFRRITDGI